MIAGRFSLGREILLSNRNRDKFCREYGRTWRQRTSRVRPLPTTRIVGDTVTITSQLYAGSGVGSLYASAPLVVPVLVALFAISFTRVLEAMELNGARVELQRVRRGLCDKEELRRLEYAGNDFMEAKIFIDDSSMATPG